jgi:Fibronectin type III domain
MTKKLSAAFVALALTFGLSLQSGAASANTNKAAYDVSAYYQVNLGYMVGWKTPTDKAGITGYTVTAIPSGKTCVVRGASANVCTFPASVIGFTGNHTFVVSTNAGASVIATSDSSNSVTPASIPVAPLAMGAEVVSDTQIDVAWVPSPSTGGAPLYGYTVTYWKSDGFGNPNNATKTELVVTGTSVSLTGLAKSTMYIINVAACNAYGCNSADRWSYNATTPITTAVTSIRLPRNIYGGNASTACFEGIYDANNGESSTGAVCGSVVANPGTYPVVVSGATEIALPALRTKFAQRATLSFSRTYSLATWRTIGISWFAHLTATSKSVVKGFVTPVNISSRTPATCEVVGPKVVLKAVGPCTITAIVEGNSVFEPSNIATYTLSVTN